MRSLLVLFCLFWATNIAQGANFEPAYIILDKDTLHGYIDRTDEVALSKRVCFTQNLLGTIVHCYSPFEIKRFGFKNDNLAFEAVEVEIRKDDITVKAMRFAKVVLLGYTQLYKLQLPIEEQSARFNIDNTFLYILNKDNIFYTLGQYEVISENGYSLKKRYIGVLNYVFSDCPQVKTLLSELNFNDKEILYAVTAYNTCIRPKESTVLLSYEVKPILKHGVEVSYGKLMDRNHYFITNSNVVSTGYFWDLMKPDLSTKISTMFGVNYQYIHYKIKEGYMKVHSIRVPFILQANLANSLKAHKQPFVSAGLTALFTPNNNIGYVNFMPMPNIGFGVYAGNMRYAALLENEGFSLKATKFVSLSLAYRLDR